MSTYFGRIFSKDSQIYKYFVKRRTKINKNIIPHIIKIKNNNHNTMTIIKLGHYQTKMSIESEKAEIIKIIGEDVKRPGYWLTIDGESIPEYALEENYVYLV